MASRPPSAQTALEAENARLTERLLACETRLAQTQTEADARFRAVVETAGEAIVLTDPAGLITMWNPGARLLFGLEKAAAIGTPFRRLFPRGRLPKELTCQHEGEHPCHEGPVEALGLRASGEVFPIEASCASWASPEGTYRSHIIRDVSARRRLARMKEEYLAMIRHDMRTPLNTVATALDTLESLAGKRLSRQARRMIEIAMSANARLSKQIDDLLELQRLGLAEMPMAVSPCDADELARAAADIVAPMAERRGMTIKVKAAPLALLADPDLLVRVLVNLLENATKYAGPGGAIHVSVVPDAGVALFEVRDEGPGIPPDRLAEAFLPFSRLGSGDPHAPGGSGLGLAICQRIIDQHGGRIWAESTLGRGTKFLFTIPTG